MSNKRVFEYKKEFDCSFLELKLYGIEGWELVSNFTIANDEEYRSKIGYLFKREVLDKAKKDSLLEEREDVIKKIADKKSAIEEKLFRTQR